MPEPKVPAGPAPVDVPAPGSVPAAPITSETEGSEATKASEEAASSPSPSTTATSDDKSSKKNLTTLEREPMPIPSSVHIRITPDNLKEYVGPPVYQKDRMYTHAPPAGVSTGLGYLGNGSGAVMPIEAMVRSFLFLQ